ncbi:hypothetical protein Scep_007305 [Stephania cephalantha]|uniref:Uncharacterized protein n=1 Tax=Stephania cephalantha TaxID=152367 RepID=A0AAP0KBD4_9MAGN
MSNYRGRRGSNPRMKEEEEVAELLRAAEDDVLLKLSVDSHSARSSDLDQGLLRRFEALKLPSNSSKITSVPPPSTQDNSGGGESKKTAEVDLSARFSALRNRNSSTEIDQQKSQNFKISGDDDYDDDYNEEDEISKVIQWAIDEARLNPSSSVDDDDDDDDDEEE